MLLDHLESNRLMPHLDVVVCTHNDADHANGLIGLLGDDRIDVDELWLPSTWAHRIDDLVGDPLDFLEELAGDIERGVRPGTRAEVDVEDVADELDVDVGPEPQPILEDRRFPEPSGQQAEPLPEAWGDTTLPEESLPQPDVEVTDLLWKSAKQAAENIRKLVHAAAKRGVPVRWFDYRLFDASKTPDGGEPWLEPVNSVEVSLGQARSSGAGLSALAYLALTTTNRESLVFRHPDDWPPSGDVLFNADSDLRFGLGHVPGPNRPVLATVPHHGSCENRDAIKKIEKWAKDKSQITWIRSDSRFPRRPCRCFTNTARPGEVFCTTCKRNGRDDREPKQPVRLFGPLGWRPDRRTRPCRCVRGDNCQH